MNRVVKVFMKRDDMTREEAVERFNELKEDVMETLQVGGSYDEVEDLLLAEGLEMDYVFDIVPF